jgi:hypothetical protein
MEKSWGKNPRDFRCRVVTATGYAPTVHGVLRDVFGPLKGAAKIIARKARVTPRTAENWLGGQNAPRGDELIRLMAECDELKAAIDKLVEEARTCRNR